jgi:hypothetical protein
MGPKHQCWPLARAGHDKDATGSLSSQKPRLLQQTNQKTITTMNQRRFYNQLVLFVVPMACVFFLGEYYALLKLDASSSSRYLRRLEESTQLPVFDVAINMSTRPPQHSKHLPNLHQDGGLIVFLHVAKTGGTTIRKNFEHVPHVLLRRVFDETELQASQPRIKSFLSKANKGRTMLLEIHGNHGEPMTVFDIHQYIQQWRALAAANHKHVFVFTLLRDPLSFDVSYFNFFKHPGCDFEWCDRPLVPALTEQNLLETAIPNHQCQYLARSAKDKAANAANPVTSTECEAVYTMLTADADWVGTTEAMQTTTLPLLSYMITGQATMDLPVHNPNKRGENQNLSIGRLSESAKQELRRRSSFDQSLHDRVQRTYTLDMWANFQSVTATKQR